jgi:4a-hydroxytetrahydrobiopterin dehydratase
MRAKVDTRASNMTEALASKPVLQYPNSRASKLHAQAPDWQLAEEAHRIERSFRFRNFREAPSVQISAN